jgi:DNA-binding NtrC family response regulator
MAQTILIVEDDPTQLRYLATTVRGLGYHVLSAKDGEVAHDLIDRRDQTIDLALVDLVLPKIDGFGVLGEIARRERPFPSIVLTMSGSVGTAVKAMRAGAADFVVKPVSPERLQISIENALKISTLSGEISRLFREEGGALQFSDLVAAAPAMRNVLDLATRAARSNIAVLLEGESGVGKEMIARAIQGGSDRAGRPFVAVNCSAIPANLVESILFGHEKRSFTGADAKHIGKFQEASGGTIFLDEVGELPLDIQAKLLRALQEGEIDPVGSKRPTHVKVRVISATNRDLAELVRDERFREDLYYRLNIFPIYVPPLRERREDIAELIDRTLRAALMAGANFSKCVLTGTDFSHTDLMGARFARADASKFSFERADLRGADLDRANLEAAECRHANFASASLQGANLSRARLQGANLRGAILHGANLGGADLQDAQISLGVSELPLDLQRVLRQHATWVDSFGAEGKRAELQGLDLSNHNLAGIYLSGADLRDCKFKGTNLSGCLMILADLNGADLSGDDLRNAELMGANLADANLRSARLTSAKLDPIEIKSGDRATGQARHASLALARLERASLTDASLKFANLSDANLHSATLDRTNMRGADLSGAVLDHAVLRQADLSESDLRDASFTGANLEGAKLRFAKFPVRALDDVRLQGADLTGTNLEG